MLNNSYFKLHKKIYGIDLKIDIDSDDIEIKKYSKYLIHFLNLHQMNVD